MLKNIFFGSILLLLVSSCVSSKIYDDLQWKYDALKAENKSLMSRLDGNHSSQGYTSESLQKEIDQLNAEKSRLAMDFAASESNLNRLKDSYDALESNSSSSLSENLERNRKLLEEIEAREKQLNELESALSSERKRLDGLKKDLAERSERVAELEGIIAAKDEKMKMLKTAISKALTNFEGNGLTVEQRDGKVYVSMENKLLFASGSWNVNARGKEAVVALGNVLATNPEIAVLIEGHTDNVAYGGDGLLQNNWDLSTKRATAIVSILTLNSQILKENLTAAGRGEHAPIASNSNADGRAKNRRIEVILTPKLDEISKLLNEL